MAFAIREFFERCATRFMALAGLAGVAACLAGLLWCQDWPGGLSLLDGRGWNSREAAALFEAFDRLDAQARAIYAATGLMIGRVFSAACGLLVALLLFRLFRAPFFLLPLAAAA